MNTIERLDRIEELQHEAQVISQIINTFTGSPKEEMHDALNEIRIELRELENDDACESFIAHVELSQLYD